MSYRVALLELERTGQVVLPEPGPEPPRKAKDNGREIKEIEPTIIEDNLSGFWMYKVGRVIPLILARNDIVINYL